MNFVLKIKEKKVSCVRSNEKLYNGGSACLTLETTLFVLFGLNI